MRGVTLIVGFVLTLIGVARAQDVYDDDGTLYLTPLIESGQVDVAIQASRVHAEQLGFDLHSHAGYLTAGQSRTNQYFFWYFRAKDERYRGAPYVIYVNGGPGVSSLVGLFSEIGPYILWPNGTVRHRAATWVNNYNVVFLDAPTLTGFSYTTSTDDLTTAADGMAPYFVELLNQFFTMFPLRQGQDVYFAGEGFSSEYAITLANYLGQSRQQTNFHLAGIVLISGVFDVAVQVDPAQFLLETAVIGPNLGRNMRAQNREIRKLVKAGRYVAASERVASLVDSLVYPNEWSNFKQQSGINGSGTIAYDVPPPEYIDYDSYIQNSRELKRALHVGENRPFLLRNTIVRDRYIRSGGLARNINRQFQAVLNSDVKVLMVVGNLNVLLPYIPTSAAFENLQWNGRYEYLTTNEGQLWRVHDDDVNSAGYVKCIRNFCMAVVRNAGFYVAADEPERTFDLFDRFVHNRRFGPNVPDL